MIRSRTPIGGFTRGLPSIGGDGRFSIANVPPGEYSIDVVPVPLGAGPGQSPEVDEMASVPITADGRDITDLIITTTPGATLTGRVIFEGTSQAVKPGRILVQPADRRASMMFRPMGDNGLIDAGGRFQLRGVTGRVLFRSAQLAPGPAPGWGLKSITLNGTDITDTPLDVSSVGDASGIEITLTDAITVLSGIVTNGQRKAVKDYVVVILPERLNEGTMPERFMRTARPNQEGRYELRGLPAGDYLAVAVAALEDGNEWNPVFRKMIEPTAKRFTLTHGQTAAIDLQLIQ
jgi:hypothetical protein